MSNILGQCKEVVEFLDTNMGRVEVMLRKVSENLDEVWPVWGNMVEEYFNGDDVAALLVIVINLFPYPQSKTSQTIIIKLSSCVQGGRPPPCPPPRQPALPLHRRQNASHDFPV